MKKAIAKQAVAWYTKNAKAANRLLYETPRKDPPKRVLALLRGIFPLWIGSPPPDISVEPLVDAVAHHTGHNGQEETKQVTHMKHLPPPPGMKDGKNSIPAFDRLRKAHFSTNYEK